MKPKVKSGGPIRGSNPTSLRRFTPPQKTRFDKTDLLTTSWLSALIPAFGSRSVRNQSARSFASRLKRNYDRLGDRYLLHLKKVLARLYSNALVGIASDATLWLQVIPKSYLPGARARLPHLQFLKWSRALPRLKDPHFVDREVAEFVGRVCGPQPARPVPPEVEDSLRRALAGFSDDYMSSVSDLIGSGSCLGSTRAQGGRTALLGADPRLSFIGELSKEYSLNGMPRGFSRQLSAIIDYGQLRLESALEKADLGFPESQALVVKELGAKLRIVTKSDPDLVFVAHSVRRALFKLIKEKSHLVVSEAQFDPELSIIDFKSQKMKLKRMYFSADFKTASDGLSFEVLDLVCNILGIDERFVHRGQSLLGGGPVTRGAFMGLPATWTILSIVHYAVAVTVDPGHSFRIKGDDLVAFWPNTYIERYRLLSQSVGLELNQSKTRSSFTAATFCEGHYRPSSYGVLRRIPTFSVRWAAERTFLSDQQTLVLLDRGVSPRKLFELQRFVYSDALKLAKNLSVPRYTPKAFGGMGLVPKKLDFQLDKSSCQIVRLVHNGVPISRDAPAHSGPAARRVLALLATARYSVNGTLEAQSRLDIAERFVLQSAALCDAASGFRPTKTVESPSRFIKRQALFRKRFRKIQGHGAPETTFGTALRVTSRLLALPPKGSGPAWYDTQGLTALWRWQQAATRLRLCGGLGVRPEER